VELIILERECPQNAWSIDRLYHHDETVATSRNKALSIAKPIDAMKLLLTCIFQASLWPVILCKVLHIDYCEQERQKQNGEAEVGPRAKTGYSTPILASLTWFTLLTSRKRQRSAEK
jgi:hypothetical protein